MEKLIFSLVLVLTAGIISLITGRGRRQIDRIPKGMGILCQPPGKRYVMYALGVVVFVIVMFFNILFIRAGAPQEARGMWTLCVALAILLLVLTILAGNMMARDCVYFNREQIQIEKAFRKPKTFKWNEIRKIDGDFDNVVNLYLADGSKILTARSNMINYELFCKVLKENSPQSATKYYRSKIYEEPKKCVLRYGTEYYMLAVMGLLIMVLYLAMLLSSGDRKVFEEMLHSDPSEWFSIWFAPVCGVVSIIALFVFGNTSVRYSPEKMIFKYPLRKKFELCWRDIQKVEIICQKKRGEESCKKLRFYTSHKVYVLKMELLTSGRDAFFTELLKMMEKYEISYMKVGK